MLFTFILWISFHGIAFGISVTVDPVKPALGDTMTVTCQRSSSSSASITWSVDSSLLTTCDGSTDNFCVPSPPGHTFSTDVSANEFNLALAAITITDCKTYTCTDTGNSETVSKNIQLADFSKNDINPTEPGANTDGLISITTGCVFSPDDLNITWSKIVNGNSVALSAIDPSPVTTTDKSSCTRTCHTEEDQKATSGFTHTEYTGTDSVTVQYMVTVSHSSYPDVYTWTSASYQLKQASTEGCCCCLIDCKDIEIGVCYFGNIMIYIIIFVVFSIIVGIVVEAIFNIWEKMSLTWRIVSFVFFLFGLSLFICYRIKKKKAGKGDKASNVVNTGSHPDEKKKQRRPQPPPPFGANSPQSQSPDIHDGKRRGLSANFTDGHHPLVSIDIPAKRAGALESIPDSAREDVTKKKKKRKRRVETEDDQSD